MHTIKSGDQGLPTVSVIIPAYNAERTLGETLASVIRQTYAHLEVVVIDDGSLDDTSSLAARVAGRDERVRVIRQANSGVAAARNTGINRTRGAFLAFIDADDLWAPTKIARQLHALEQAGPNAGLCYCWFQTIDEDGAVQVPANKVSFQGAVLQQLCRRNFVGQCSSMLVRRAVLKVVGGFDVSLQARGAQGCEDYDLLLRIAECCDYVLVPEVLVGYRISNNSMSTNLSRMLKSWMIVSERMQEKHPEMAAALTSGRCYYASVLMIAAVQRRCISEMLAVRSHLWSLGWRFPSMLGALAVKRSFQAVVKGLFRSTNNCGLLGRGLE